MGGGARAIASSGIVFSGPSTAELSRIVVVGGRGIVVVGADNVVVVGSGNGISLSGPDSGNGSGSGGSVVEVVVVVVVVGVGGTQLLFQNVQLDTPSNLYSQ